MRLIGLNSDLFNNAEEIAEVKVILTRQPEIDRIYRVELKDRNGVVHSVVERTVYKYIANKDHYKQNGNSGRAMTDS